MKAVIFVSAIILVMGCQNKKVGEVASATSLELLTGEIALCGYSPGLFGDVNFGSSCSEQVREDFNLAIALLHSFEYDEAEKVFATVIGQDPECVMAYWGVAMCNFHALWRPPTREDLKKGSAAIKVAKSLQQKTNRESDYIRAIAAFYQDWEKVDHNTRKSRFAHEMERVYNEYPNDSEAAIFYALALNSSADLSDKTYRNQIKAGSILESLFPGEPDHPGIAHYIIHSYDYPKLASRALNAARRYASIAPASAHAQHMPSHIFTRLGLWEESISSNLDATSSAKCYAEQIEMEGHWDEEIHGTDYLVYAYLQTGRLIEAQELVQYVNSIEKISPIGIKGAYPTAAIPARYLLETRNWELAKNLTMASDDYPTKDFPWSNGIIHFARALGAAHSNDLEKGRLEVDKLKECTDYLVEASNDYMADQVKIMAQSAEAWYLLRKGDKQEAIDKMRYAADLEMKTEKQPLTPGEVLPAQELLGDLLMEVNNPKEALNAYELNLEMRPNRFNGLYGAAISAKAVGDYDKAVRYFEQLLELCASSTEVSRMEIDVARQFLKEHSL